MHFAIHYIFVPSPLPRYSPEEKPKNLSWVLQKDGIDVGRCDRGCRVYGLVDIELCKNFSRIFLTISDTCLSAVRPREFSAFSSSCLCSFSCISWILDSSVKLSSSLSRRRPASSGTHSHTATHSLAVAGVGAGCGSGLPSHLFPLACCRRVVSHLLLHALWPFWYSAYLLASLDFPRLPFLRSLTTWSQLIL